MATKDLKAKLVIEAQTDGQAEVQALVQQVLPVPATLQLHYLDGGLEVEAELQAAVPAAELARLQQALHDTLSRATRVGRVTLRCATLDGRP